MIPLEPLVVVAQRRGYEQHGAFGLSFGGLYPADDHTQGKGATIFVESDLGGDLRHVIWARVPPLQGRVESGMAALGEGRSERGELVEAPVTLLLGEPAQLLFELVVEPERLEGPDGPTHSGPGGT